MNLIRLLILVCLFNSCTTNQAQEKEIFECCSIKKSICVKGDNYKGILLDTITTDGILQGRKLTSLDILQSDFKQVERSNVEKLEKSIQAQLKQFLFESKISDLDSYYRQYIKVQKEEADMILISFLKPKFEGEINSLTNYICSEFFVAQDYGKNFIIVVYDNNKKEIVSIRQ